MTHRQPADTVQPAPDRRAFLGASGALMLSFALPASAWAAGRQATMAPAHALNAWVRIGRDDTVTVICGSAEMGQGVLTAIPMLLAEELDADWARVKVEQAPADPAYNNPMFGMQATGGSTTVRGHWEPLRQAGAAARAMLVAAAAERWKVDATQCRTEAGVVIGPGRRRARYGELAEAAARQPVPTRVTLKDSKDFRILGQPKKRLDTPAKLDGSAKYGIDAQVSGMLVAVMARAPMPGAKVRTLDDSAAKAVPGVRQVISIPHGVAVLADGYWTARKGRDALKIDWDQGDSAALSTAKVEQMLGDAARAGAPSVAKAAGDLAAGRAGAARTLEADYSAPYLAHACMEPMNCTARVQGDEVEIWAGTQSQGPAQGILGSVAQVAPAKVKVHTMMLGGGFGRRFAPDFAIDATLLSKLSGKPVKLIYTREDDMAAGYYRPAAAARFTGALDGSGKLVALSADVASPSIMAASGFMKIPENGVDAFAVEGIADMPYDIPNLRLAYARQEPGPQVWFWRSVGHSQNIFFMEGFIDELAVAAGRDPYEFRRSLLGQQPRYRGVLEAAAQKAGWGSPLPAGVFRGIAVGQSFGSYVAEVAEVSVAADGTPRVHRVVAAVDCGQVVNPAIVERQIEGGIVYGLSAALHGKLEIEAGRVTTGNFHQYPVLRMNEMPKVEVHILASREKPGGIGEPGTPPIAPAVVNAIAAATGQRLRSLPIDPARLRKT
ncbi:xanthine dehydrogenase family protein molybdopterin-binding subunit [Leptothrix discophora]|uniref:Xanthine dehydrogenase family protein molybdopterin-binding subunit n=1 Tax=Leptothrix discophora TaxID=89 RepID=A0ABT9FYZ3_LEPDI|nr:xanthine dehydrogenase family protein molybdopterin-binding subunit [Leptothrix discophora]MDP4299458.1 xanthine dehydrogenase family protein molybdopterin-binding subunit [Leptothrix discophora]